MMRKKVIFASLAVFMFAQAAAAAVKTVEVDNVADFLKNIEPDTKIVLAAGEYVLPGKGAPAEEFVVSEYTSWEDVFGEGMELIVKGVKNLTIEGAGANKTRLISPVTYADVIKFNDCGNIAISGVTIGHVEASTCTGDVLSFSNVDKIDLEGVDLFGCGVRGLTLMNAGEVTVKDSVIHDCSDSLLHMENVRTAAFTGVKFALGTGEYARCLMEINYVVKNVTFSNCDFSGSGKECLFATYYESSTENIVIENSRIDKGSFSGKGSVWMEDSGTFGDGIGMMEESKIFNMKNVDFQ